MSEFQQNKGGKKENKTQDQVSSGAKSGCSSCSSKTQCGSRRSRESASSSMNLAGSVARSDTSRISAKLDPGLRVPMREKVRVNQSKRRLQQCQWT